MSRIILSTDQLRNLRETLLASPNETCAVLVGRAVIFDGRLTRIVVQEILWPAAEDYRVRSEIAAQLRPEFVAALAHRVRRSGESLVFVHTHPFPLNQFSQVDDEGERRLADFFEERRPGGIHAAMLLTPEISIARVLGTRVALQVIGCGAVLEWGDTLTTDTRDPIFDRQIRAFGAMGQARLGKLRIGIVGLGGTGSVVLEQLSHLGVGRFLLMDPDVVEISNLNRLVGATPSDVGRAKVEVAADYARRINPNVVVEVCTGSVLLASKARMLTDTDLVFSCTDTQGSRAVLNQLAYQYLVPVIDIGTVIRTQEGKITSIYGRTQMLAPGLGCMMCGGLLNPEIVRVDLLSDFERRNDPYIVGEREPAPAVISLNSTMSSQAVTMFLAVVSGIPSRARQINYDAMSGTCRPAAISIHPTCYVCSPHRGLARADEWDAPGRRG